MRSACVHPNAHPWAAGDTIHAVHCIPFFPRSGVYALPDGRIAAVDFDALLSNQDQFLMAAEKAVHDWCSGVLDTAKASRVSQRN